MQFHLSYQSKVGPVQWLKPYTDVYIRQLAEEQQVRLTCCVADAVDQYCILYYSAVYHSSLTLTLSPLLHYGYHC